MDAALGGVLKPMSGVDEYMHKLTLDGIPMK